jgi:CDP-glucose 4,6-dehydratase
VLVITSDKVYENQEAEIEFAETAPLGGHDPYSASKASAEILTRSYQRSFFAERGIPVMTARAGNVIGGGDWARDRLIPDLWRAYKSNVQVFIRNPDAVRPWQHVLDPIYGYLLYIQHMVSATGETPASLNFGPPSKPVRTVLQVAEQFAASMEAKDLWTLGKSPNQVHESGFLSIDSTLAFDTLGWKTSLTVDEALRWTCDWYKAYQTGQDMRSFTEHQIDAYADRVQASALPAHAETELT